MSQNRIYTTDHIETDASTKPMQIVSSAKDIKESYCSYLRDEARLTDGYADELAFPESEGQVVEFVKKASDKNKLITISGARTGIVGGAVPYSGSVISTEKIKKILGIKKDIQGQRWYLSVQPGLSLQELNHAIKNKQEINLDIPGWQDFQADERKFFYPPDPTEDTASIGGTIATNASGARSYRYGPTRNYVNALKIVLADGEVVDIRRGQVKSDETGSVSIVCKDGHDIEIVIPQYSLPAVKNTAGYYINKDLDMIDLFIGSEGTLGIFLEAELVLIPAPEAVLSMMTFFHSESAAVELVKKIRADKRFNLLAIEYFDNRSLSILRKKREDDPKIPEPPEFANAAILLEIEYGNEEELETIYENMSEELLTYNTSIEDTWAALDDQDAAKIKQFRHSLPEAINEIIGKYKLEDDRIHKVSTDMAVPDNALSEILDFYKSTLEREHLEYAIFGHIGDNHLHVNVLPRNFSELEKAKEVYVQFAQKAVALGGSISGEHGIGKIKTGYLNIQYKQEDIEEMLRIKKALDPKGLLQRGTIFAEFIFCQG